MKTPEEQENHWLVNYIVGLTSRKQFDEAEKYVDNWVKERIEKHIQRERKRIAEEYDNLRDGAGRNLRFYLFPHTEHKEGDDGTLTKDNHPNLWGCFCICKKCCEARKKIKQL